MEILDYWWDIIRDGLHHISLIQGGIIALIFGFAASSVMSVVGGALGASVLYVVVDLAWPVIFQHRPFAFPVMDNAFAHFFIALYFAFLLVIALIYIIRAIIDGIRG